MHITQQDFRVELDEPLAVAEDRFILPPRLQVNADAQLAQQPVGHAVVPTTGVGPGIAHTDLLEVEDRDLEAVVFEACRRGCDQTGLSTAIGRNDVRVAAGHDGLVEHVVGAAAHVAGAHGVQWRSYTEELARRIEPGAFATGRLFVRMIRHGYILPQ